MGNRVSTLRRAVFKAPRLEWGSMTRDFVLEALIGRPNWKKKADGVREEAAAAAAAAAACCSVLLKCFNRVLPKAWPCSDRPAVSTAVY